IPKKLFNTKNYRIKTPTLIDDTIFRKLFDLAKESDAEEDYGSEGEFPEGREVELTHKSRGRKTALVRAAKNEIRAKNGRLYCQACGFDFFAKYGDVGLEFIEAHHTLPVSELTGQGKTRVSDIALVCSNCHRMLHRRRPWLTMKVLTSLVRDHA